ncbi:MAG: YihY/virulence factor BrkB family protein [Ignavibacteria bacterium]|nr:YihY/virulence factor BrkB family protein [Ignavibacteria bacterium]
MILNLKVQSVIKVAKSAIKETYRTVYEFTDITDRRHIFLLSAGIAFNQLICMIPLILLVISVVSGFIDETSTKEAVQIYLNQLLPQNIEATRVVAEIIFELTTVFNYGTITGVIAGFVLLWLSSALFSSLRTGLNAIFHIPTPKFFVWYKLKDLLLTVITALLILLTTSLSPLLTIAEQYGRNLLSQPTEVSIFGFTGWVFSVLAAAIMFFTMYRFVPNRKLEWPIIFMSTGFAITLWELARLIFSLYINGASNFGKFYGGYVVLASLGLWFYYSAFIFLVSAELGQYIYVRYTEHRAPDI